MWCYHNNCKENEITDQFLYVNKGLIEMITFALIEPNSLQVLLLVVKSNAELSNDDKFAVLRSLSHGIFLNSRNNH